jgi:hypothetical protein
MTLTAVKGGWVNSKSLWKMDEALVDGETWYTVKCAKLLSAWVRQQPAGDWVEHIDGQGYVHLNMFDVHEKLYTVLLLKASE